MALVAIVPALLIGFLAGLLTFKVKTKWCPACGETLRCPHCSRARGIKQVLAEPTEPLPPVRDHQLVRPYVNTKRRNRRP